MVGSVGTLFGLSTPTSGAGAAVAIRSRATSSAQASRLAASLKWPAIALESHLKIGESLQFVYGAGSKWAGKAGAVYRESASKFTAFDLVCTHMGCTVVPLGAEGHCPCHHSSYSLDIDRHGCVVADPQTGATSRQGVFAGGDIVTGAATGGPALELNTGSLTPSKIVVSRGVIRWVKDL